MFEYLQSLSVVHQVFIAVAIAVGFNSVRNYGIYLIAVVTGADYRQSNAGKIIDWTWLSLVIYLLLALA